MSPKVVLFDLFGTLLNVESVANECESVFPGVGAQLSRAWREKQLRYTWLRTLMVRYANFEEVTQDALIAACGELGLDANAGLLRDLASAFLRLKPFPEVPEALESLMLAGFRLGVLSNGTRQQLQASQAALGVPLMICSADDVRLFKPAPQVYAFGVEQAQVEIGEVLFVSANAWDVAGARAFGLSCAWLNRTHGAFEELDVKPTTVVHDLEDLVRGLEHGIA